QPHPRVAFLPGPTQRPKTGRFGHPAVVKTIGDHLRKRCLDLEIRQRDVADRIGPDTTTITNWELRHTEPGFGWMPPIIGFLGDDPRPTARAVGEAPKQHRMGC